jgi:hypothetical protein
MGSAALKLTQVYPSFFARTFRVLAAARALAGAACLAATFFAGAFLAELLAARRGSQLSPERLLPAVVLDMDALDATHRRVCLRSGQRSLEGRRLQIDQLMVERAGPLVLPEIRHRTFGASRDVLIDAARSAQPGFTPSFVRSSSHPFAAIWRHGPGVLVIGPMLTKRTDFEG